MKINRQFWELNDKVAFRMIYLKKDGNQGYIKPKICLKEVK